MKYYLKIYNLYFKQAITIPRLFLISIILLMVVFLIYKAYLKITEKTMYVCCLYSETGILGKGPYENYSILVDSFKHALNKYDCNINIIPLYKDLGDKLENFSDWAEECAKKYNVKYFFGCWRSSERLQVIPVIEKYNGRLFYPLQYEGCEAANEVYYFGGCPNQHIYPGLEYIIRHFYYYDDIYIIGSGSVYAKTVIELVKTFMKVHHPNKKIVYTKLYDIHETDFSEFIDVVYKKSPNGAIILNLTHGKGFYEYSKQFYEKYYSIHDIVEPAVLNSSIVGYNFVKSNGKNEIVNVYRKYPTLSTRVFENEIDKNYIKYIKETFTVSNFASQVLDEPIYFPNKGFIRAEQDYDFLLNYKKKHHKPIGDSQYNTLISSLFFVKMLKIVMDNNKNIYDPEDFDDYSKGLSIFGISGPHDMFINGHITKLFYILKIFEDIEDTNYKIIYDSYNILSPDPYVYVQDNIIYSNAYENTMNILQRMYA